MSILFGSVPHRVLVGQAHSNASQFERKSLRSGPAITVAQGGIKILSMVTDFESPQSEPKGITDFHVHVSHVHFPDVGRQ